MEKIFKKSLALVLSAALCLTALIGCLTVSAEGASATVTVGSVEVNSDATKATVPVTVKTDDANGIAAAMFELKVDSSKLTFNSVWEESITWDDKTNINVQTVLGELDAEGTTQRVVPVSGEIDTYRFLVEAIKDGSSDTLGYIKSATFNITFDIVAGTTGTIDIVYVNDGHSQACNGGTFDVNTATYSGNEALIPLTGTNGKVTVKAASTEPVVLSFQMKAPAIQVREKYGFRFRIDHNDTFPEYDHYDILLETKQYKGGNYELTDYSEVFTVDKRDSSSTASTDFYFYRDVTAYALNVSITLTVRFYNADNTCVAKSTPRVFDIASLAKDKLAAAGTAANLKTLYMDMLNYGTAAQVYFSQFGTGNPLATATAINDGCEDYQQYATAETPVLVGVNDPQPGESGITCTPGLQIAASNNIYYRFTIPAETDVSGLKLTISHVSLFGTTVQNTYDVATLAKDSRGRYILGYDKIDLYDADKVVTATISSDVGDLYSIKYNINEYVISRLSTNDLYTTLAKFSTSTKNYFLGN